MVDIRDAARDRVLDRDHAEIDPPLDDRRKRIFESRVWHGLEIGKEFSACQMRISAGLALIGDAPL